MTLLMALGVAVLAVSAWALVAWSGLQVKRRFPGHSWARLIILIWYFGLGHLVVLLLAIKGMQILQLRSREDVAAFLVVLVSGYLGVAALLVRRELGRRRQQM